MTIGIDIRSSLPGARDQGARPTCLAFAISDAHMHAARLPEFLSPEYLHYYAASRSGVGLNAGVGLVKLQEALRLDGQPSEAECPYSGARDDEWMPPSGLRQVWRRSSLVSIGTPTESLMAALQKGRAHVLVLRISRSFHTPDPATHVVIDDGGQDRRLHAVLVVGVASIAGGPAFLVRNSWGSDWGVLGHAWLPDAYVDARAVNVVELETEGSQE